MDKYDLHRLQSDSSKSNIYINGLGFVDISKTQALIFQIRRMSNVMLSCALLYFFLSSFFVLPLTYIFYILGGNIIINFYTGLITSTLFHKTTIFMLSNIASLAFVSLFLKICYRKFFISAPLFKKPYAGVNSIATPIVISMGILGIVCEIVMQRFFTLFGFVFSFSISPITELSLPLFYSFLLSLVFYIVQEIFFRGCILTPLRRFGDGFAIIASSVVFALWTSNGNGFVSSLLLAIPLSYFVIRSGSVFTAIIARLTFEILGFLLRLCYGHLENSLAIVIILLTILITIFYTGYAFVTYVKSDKKAFYLVPSSNILSLEYKLFTFFTSIIFIIFCGHRLFQIILSLQVIG